MARDVVQRGLEIIKAKNLPIDTMPIGLMGNKGLSEKIRAINGWDADIAIESHFNSAGNNSAHGCETLYFSLPFIGRFSREGKRLAEIIQKKTVKNMMVRDRGAKGMSDIRRVIRGKETFPVLSFLTRTQMPAIITEPLFISNYDEALLFLGSRRVVTVEQLAWSVVEGLIEYMEAGV
jgi:N-acetylmuramoyl-L-alanine amidase